MSLNFEFEFSILGVLLRHFLLIGLSLKLKTIKRKLFLLPKFILCSELKTFKHDSLNIYFISLTLFPFLSGTKTDLINMILA